MPLKSEGGKKLQKYFIKIKLKKKKEKTRKPNKPEEHISCD